MTVPEKSFNEQDRLAELIRYALLDTGAEKDFDDLVTLASVICEVPISLITLIDEERQWFKSKIGIDIQETHRNIAFCAHAMHQSDLMMVEDARLDQRFTENPLVVGDPNIRFYAGMPLVSPNGYALGTLCVIDDKPRRLNASQQHCLQLLARQVVQQMELRRINRLLIDTTEKLHRTTQGVQVGTFEYDLVSKILTCDEVLYQLYGVKNDTYINAFETWANCIHPQDLNTTNEKLRTAAIDPLCHLLEMEFRVVWPDHTIHYIKSKASIERDSNSLALRMLGVNWDITAIKQREEENLSIKEILDNTNDIARIGTWEVNTLSGAITWSRVTREIHEVQEDFIPELTTAIHFYKEGDSRSAIQQAVSKSMELGVSYDLELELVTAKGKSIWVRSIGQSEFKDGKCVRMYGIFQDIHEIKSAQLALHKINGELNAIFNTESVAIISTDIAGVITHFNHGAEIMLQYTAEELVGKNTPAVFHLQKEMLKRADELSMQHERIIQGFDVFVEGAKNGTIESLEWTYVRKDGTVFPVQLVVTALKDQHGDLTGFLGVATDITENKKASQAIVEAKLLAEKSAMLKETFLANMSHEIRTPMNAIIGFTDLLLKRNLGKEEKEYIQLVKNSGENLLRIINDVLDVSKINAGMMSFEESPILIPEIFNSLQLLVSPQAIEKQLNLVFEADSRLALNVLGDATRLTQILLNLIGNALKFTAEGSIKVTAQIEKEDEAYYTILFSVKDSGVGIAEDKLQLVFERFTQAESHTSRSYGGTGLGLNIAKQLVELQGGEIVMKSMLGVGTLVSFILPFKKINQEVLILPATLSKVKEEPRKRTFLLVDDNPINIKLLLGVLADRDITFDVAQNGKEAIAKVQHHRYDLVLMDIEMPEMNGYEATSYIRKELKNDVPIIAMTAHALSGEREKCLALGMNDYLSKPVSVDALLEKIAAVFSNEKEIEDAYQVIHLDFLSTSMGNKSELMLEVLVDCPETIADDLTVLLHAIAQYDYDTVKRRIHRFKTSVHILQAHRIEMVLKKIEALALTQEINKVEVLTKELEELCHTAMSEIKVAINKLSGHHA
jgi:PAS domain S-box-containing protein